MCPIPSDAEAYTDLLLTSYDIPLGVRFLDEGKCIMCLQLSHWMYKLVIRPALWVSSSDRFKGETICIMRMNNIAAITVVTLVYHIYTVHILCEKWL